MKLSLSSRVSHLPVLGIEVAKHVAFRPGQDVVGGGAVVVLQNAQVVVPDREPVPGDRQEGVGEAGVVCIVAYGANKATQQVCFGQILLTINLANVNREIR